MSLKPDWNVGMRRLARLSSCNASSVGFNGAEAAKEKRDSESKKRIYVALSARPDSSSPPVRALLGALPVDRLSGTVLLQL